MRREITALHTKSGMIEIKNLTKIYGNILAVDDLSFTVNDNEILGFLGPNGAGKSTTMNIITGYLPASSGQVLVDGVDINDDPMAVRRKIGYLPEQPPVYMDMKVREYLEFCAGIKQIPKNQIKSSVEKAMSMLRITDVQKRLIKNLSKGYRQRVGFAQAILADPKVLILDEPTVGLDPNQTLEVRNVIKSLKKDRTIIFSSHILQEVSAVCERVVIIDKGKIKAVDTPWNLAHGMDRHSVYSLKIEGDKNKAYDLLKSVNGVRQIYGVEELDANTNQFKIDVTDQRVRQSVLKRVVDSDLALVEFTEEKTSLEDVFVSLTSKKAR